MIKIKLNEPDLFLVNAYYLPVYRIWLPETAIAKTKLSGNELMIKWI